MALRTGLRLPWQPYLPWKSGFHITLKTATFSSSCLWKKFPYAQRKCYNLYLCSFCFAALHLICSALAVVVRVAGCSQSSPSLLVDQKSVWSCDLKFSHVFAGKGFTWLTDSLEIHKAAQLDIRYGCHKWNTWWSSENFTCCRSTIRSTKERNQETGHRSRLIDGYRGPRRNPVWVNCLDGFLRHRLLHSNSISSYSAEKSMFSLLISNTSG